MTTKLVETLISATIGGVTSLLVAVLQHRMTRRWNRADQSPPPAPALPKPEE